MYQMSRISPALRSGQPARAPVSLAVAPTTPTVFVVDGDDSVRDGMTRLIRRSGWRAETFSSFEQLLRLPPAASPACLVLDVTLRNLKGTELQRRVLAERPGLPVVLTRGYGEVLMTVQAVGAGVVRFLPLPAGESALLTAMQCALDHSADWLHHEAKQCALRARHAALSPREKQVMELVVRGLLNKQVGSELGISEITVKAHRGRVMRKMLARTLPDLVNMAASLERAVL